MITLESMTETMSAVWLPFHSGVEAGLFSILEKIELIKTVTKVIKYE